MGRLGRRQPFGSRGKRGLIDLFDRFAVAIQYDFRHELVIDVLDYFAGERSWHEFYEYLHELPRWGKFHSALEMDEEYARVVHEQRRKMRQEQEDRFWDGDEDESEQEQFEVETRSSEGYTPLLAAVHTLDEHVQALTSVTIKLHSKSKPPPLTRAPRPITMIDVMDKMEERDEMHELSRAFGFTKER